MVLTTARGAQVAAIQGKQVKLLVLAQGLVQEITVMVKEAPLLQEAQQGSVILGQINLVSLVH
jgi:hypothetical protein